MLGSALFFLVMFAFFQSIFTLAAPLQDGIETFFAWLGTLVAEHVSTPWLASFLGNALIGGIGGVSVRQKRSHRARSSCCSCSSQSWRASATSRARPC